MIKPSKQNKLRNYVANRFYQNQSMLIQHLFEEGIFTIDDIKNFFQKTEKEADEEAKPAEICEWWTCDSWLIDQLKSRGEAILETDFGDWWGRQATGQAIYMDTIIEEIFDDYN